MAREVVKFNGKPTEIELVYSTGKEGSGEYGPFWTYTLAGDRVMFASDALNAQIQELRPHKGMRLAIQLLAGNRWDVRPVDPPAEQPRTPTPVVAPAVQQGAYGQSNGSTLMNGQAQGRLAHFTAAVDLCLATKHYAHLSGLSLEIRFEDVRAVANTISISVDKQGGR